MIRAARCLACDAAELDFVPALVAPFVRARALDDGPRTTRLAICRRCGLRFFEHRYTDEELARLYADYRGEGYFRARRRFEPWYTRRVHADVAGTPATVEARKAALLAALEPRLDTKTLGAVVDWGGDRGQLLPEALGARRFVHEISGVEPVAGVTLLTDEAAVAEARPDLVICSNVLEHVPSPRAVLAAMRAVSRGRRVACFVEVPDERPSLGRLVNAPGYASYLAALARSPLATMAVDLYSTYFRVFRGRVPPLGFVRLHEHASFFDGRSLRALLETEGFEVDFVERVEGPIGPMWTALAHTPVG